MCRGRDRYITVTTEAKKRRNDPRRPRHHRSFRSGGLGALFSASGRPRAAGLLRDGRGPALSCSVNGGSATEGVGRRFRNHVDSLLLRGHQVARELQRETSEEVDSRFKGKEVARNKEIVEKEMVSSRGGAEVAALDLRKEGTRAIKEDSNYIPLQLAEGVGESSSPVLRGNRFQAIGAAAIAALGQEIPGIGLAIVGHKRIDGELTILGQRKVVMEAKRVWKTIEGNRDGN
ncbi:hypothetical protein COLO4_33859 [Corchorus olitorius]|uniref:Uncharacterized protein n=1 Tax=Corchorus olitorius TaxID=93759 RepID=A0A1R3GQD1_9ROSI|nr:hypothetical protein COLO4_33859 [Corchorus olitorius]